MRNTQKIIKTAISAVLALATTTAALTAATTAFADPQEMEKCYGISKAGKNDCPTAQNACAGSTKKDRQADAFILVPKGLCAKIAGGSLTPGKDE